MDLGRLDILLPDGARERDTQRDGLFSYAGEYHAFIISLVAVLFGGFPMATLLAGAIINEQSRSPPGRLNPIALKELRREPWYGLGGVVVGVLGNQYLVSLGYLPQAHDVIAQYLPELTQFMVIWL